MALGSIVIDLLLKTGAFSTDTKKAERRLKEMEKTAKKVGAAIGTAAVAVGSATAYMINSAINSMAQLDKMAQQIGVATEELTGLRYAAEQMAGVTEGQFDMALRRMTRRIEEAAAGGGPAADALDRMGLSAQKLSRMAPDEQFRKFAEAIRNTSSQGERLRNVMALMDTEGMPLVTMMQQGASAIGEFEAEAARLGLTIETEAARAATEFRANMDRLKSSVQGVAQQVAANLLPDLIRLTDEMVRSGTEGDKLASTATKISDAIRVLGSVVSGIATVFNVAGNALATMMAYVDGLQTSLTGLLTFDWAKLRRGINIALIGTEGFMENTGIGMPDPVRDLSPVFADEGEEPAGMFRMSEAELAMERAREAAAEAAEAARREAEARAAASAAAAGGAKERAAAERELADAIRATEEAERKATEAEMAAEDRRLGWMNRIDDMVAQVEGPVSVALVNYRRQMADLNAALAVGEVSMENYQRGAQALGQTLGDVVAEVDTATGEMTVFAEQAARNIQSFLGDATYDLLDGSFRDIADSFSDMIKRMMAELAASKLLDMLAQIGKNNSGTWWGSILGGLSGERASGGNVASGGTYLVGERGPELLRMGPNSGTIVPNHALGGGGVRVQVINNGPPVQAQASSETQPDGTQLVRLVLNEVASDIASGGVVARAGKSRFGWKEQV